MPRQSEALPGPRDGTSLHDPHISMTHAIPRRPHRARLGRETRAERRTLHRSTRRKHRTRGIDDPVMRFPIPDAERPV